MVSLNLLKHMGSHFNYSVLVPMFHKVLYQGEFSMLRKGPKVQGPALTVPVPLPRAQDPKSAPWPCPRNTTAGPVSSSPQPCPGITIPRRCPVPSTGAVLVTCGCPAPVWGDGTGPDCQALPFPTWGDAIPCTTAVHSLVAIALGRCP